MKTEKYIITIGTNEGYENNSAQMSPAEFGKIANKLAKELFERTGVYPTFTLQSANVFYNNEWGCPETGEPVFILAGVRNPEFTPDADYCCKTWKVFASVLKRFFKQTTVTLEVVPCELHRLAS